MALKVQLKKYGATVPGTNWYSFTALTIEHAVNRLPVQAGLPAKGIILLDLGIFQEQISIRGIVDTTANKLLYRTAAADWYTDVTDYKTGNGYMQLILNSSESYLGAIKSITFRQEAGMLDSTADQGWDFDLTFLVFAKV